MQASKAVVNFFNIRIAPLRKKSFQFQTDRAVVAAGDVGVYGGFFQPVVEVLRSQEVVDAPSGIVLTGFETVAPPRIDARHIGVEVAPRIGEARRQEVCHLLPFFVGEAGVLMVRLGVLEVDFFMGHVEVAADDDRLVPVQFQQVLAEVVFPFHAVRQAGQFALGIGCIAGHEVVFREFQGDQAPFVVVLVDAHTVADGQGRQAGEDGRAAVAFAVGIVPVLFIARQVQVYLAGLELRFLQAEDVGVEGLERIHEAFLHDSPQAVDVPGNKFCHANHLSSLYI